MTPVSSPVNTLVLGPGKYSFSDFVKIGVPFTVVVMVVWHLFSRTLDLAFRLPVLYSINHLAGGIVGLLKGLLVMFIAAWLLTHSVLPWDVVAQTHLVRFFCTASPLSLLGWFH